MSISKEKGIEHITHSSSYTKGAPSTQVKIRKMTSHGPSNSNNVPIGLELFSYTT